MATSKTPEGITHDNGPALLPWLAGPLRETLQRQRAHALLVHGPSGVGQFGFALALAAAWLCETPRPDGEPACGHCGSCRLVAARSHPDLRLVVPDALRAEAGLEAPDTGSDDDGKKRKPSREIRIEQIRGALDFSELTAGRARLKVLLLHPAEQMNAVAANALLKTLEEPGGAQRFVLSCGAPEQLLPTIRSRCQGVRLALPPRADALAWLGAQIKAAPDEAAALLDACGGEPLTALERARAGLDGAAWRDFPQAVQQGRVAAVSGWPLPVLIDALHKLCLDQQRLVVGAAPRYFPALTLRPGADPARLNAWAAELRRLGRHADHPWNAALLAELLLAQAAKAAEPAPQSIHSRP